MREVSEPEDGILIFLLHLYSIDICNGWKLMSVMFL